MELVTIAAAFILVWLGGFWIGVSTLLGYMIWRLMRNAGWDKSNITNALRLLSHVILHPHDFGKLYYLTDVQIAQLLQLMAHGDRPLQRPFWYTELDEFEGVVKSRPEE